MSGTYFVAVTFVAAFSFMKGNHMKQPRLNLYLVDLKYIRNLSHVDDNVMSVSPQIGKSTRPFVGIIVNVKSVYEEAIDSWKLYC